MASVVSLLVSFQGAERELSTDTLIHVMNTSRWEEGDEHSVF